jgi:N-acetylmuramoyl-L-alanine amidase
MRWSNPLISILLAAMVFCFAAPDAMTANYRLPPAAAQAASSSSSAKATASPTVQAPAPPEQTPAAKKAAPEFLVIIDPSHGGDDKGVTYGNKLLEKEITLIFARELRKELDDRGIAAHLLRETAISLPMEKRAEISNGHHNAIYIAIHAGRPGQGVRIYSATLPAPSPGAGPFMPWSTAQSSALARSRILAKAVVDELQKKKLQVMGLHAPLRPLNNIINPAIAVELAPNGEDRRSQESLKTQSTVAAAVAAGIAASRGQMGIHP